MLGLTNLEDTRYISTVQLPNNSTINATKTGSIPMSGSLITHAKRHTVLMDYIVPFSSTYVKCVTMTAKPY